MLKNAFGFGRLLIGSGADVQTERFLQTIAFALKRLRMKWEHGRLMWRKITARVRKSRRVIACGPDLKGGVCISAPFPYKM
jgi:hypothetical protein